MKIQTQSSFGCLCFQSAIRFSRLTAALPASGALVAAGFVAVLPVHAAVELVPFRLEETRILPLGDDKVSRGFPSLKLTLSLKGPEAEAAVRYGDLKLEVAVDDQGGNLIPEKDAFNDSSRFKDYANAFFRSNPGFGNQSPAAPQIDISLAVPRRSAAKIAHLKGTVSLAQKGNIRSVELTGLKSPGPKTLAIPAEANLQIVATVGSGENARSINVQISGDEGALESIEVLDGAGQKISSGMSSWSLNGGPVHKSLDLGKPVDDSMKLVAKVATDRKIVTIPFDLSNVPLP